MKAKLPIRGNRKAPPNKSEHWADIWLPRLSHFSQFGLFAFTIGSLYFTVIPLYQKAALEEQIARKEAESKVVERAFEESYSRLRAYLVKEFVFQAGPRCTGLLTPMPPPPVLGRRTPPRMSFSEEALTHNISECLSTGIEKSAGLKDLRKSDQVIFVSAVKQLGQHLESYRLEALSAYERVLENGKKDPGVLEPPDMYSQNVLNFLSTRGLTSKEQLESQRFDASVKATQRKIASDFGTDARSRIAALKDISWVPSEK